MTTTTYVANVVGMGWTTASGDRIEDVFQTLLESQTGIAPAPSERSLRSDLAAMLPGEWSAEMREKLIALTKRTALQALEDSGAGEPVPEERRFLIVGTSLDSVSTARRFAGSLSTVGLTRWRRRLGWKGSPSLPPALRAQTPFFWGRI